MHWNDRVIDSYIQRNALKTGTFHLAGGGISDFYIDGRIVTTYPPALRVIAEAFSSVIDREGLLPGETNLVVPCGVSGIPIGTALAIEINRQFVIDRGAPKGHGLGKQFEGRFTDEPRCLVVDDLVTAGGTIIKTVLALREHGKQVTDALVIVDREEGGREELAKVGVNLHALVTKADLRRALLSQPVG